MNHLPFQTTNNYNFMLMEILLLSVNVAYLVFDFNFEYARYLDTNPHIKFLQQQKCI